MAVVSDIKKQAHSDRRFNVFLDGSYGFGLSDLDLSVSGLRVGQTLTEDEVAAYGRQSEVAKMYDMALRLVEIRPRSRRELIDCLRRKQSSPETSAVVLQQLERLGLVDDVAFAASWVASRQALRPRSKWQLEQELRAKGIAREVIAGAVGDLDTAAEYAAVVELAQRKAGLSAYREPVKLVAYLIRKGFSYDMAKRAAQSVAGVSEEANFD